MGNLTASEWCIDLSPAIASRSVWCCSISKKRCYVYSTFTSFKKLKEIWRVMLPGSTSACLCLFGTPDQQILAATRSDHYEVWHVHRSMSLETGFLSQPFAGTLDFHLNAHHRIETCCAIFPPDLICEWLSFGNIGYGSLLPPSLQFTCLVCANDRKTATLSFHRKKMTRLLEIIHSFCSIFSLLEWPGWDSGGKARVFIFNNESRHQSSKKFELCWKLFKTFSAEQDLDITL